MGLQVSTLLAGNVSVFEVGWAGGALVGGWEYDVETEVTVETTVIGTWDSVTQVEYSVFVPSWPVTVEQGTVVNTVLTMVVV